VFTVIAVNITILAGWFSATPGALVEFGQRIRDYLRAVGARCLKLFMVVSAVEIDHCFHCGNLPFHT